MLSCELRGVTLSKIMTNSEQKLRKENKELKDEVAELKMKLEKVLKGVILERKNFITYLGLLIDEKLSWKTHIHSVANKVSKTIGQDLNCEVKTCCSHLQPLKYLSVTNRTLT